MLSRVLPLRTEAAASSEHTAHIVPKANMLAQVHLATIRCLDLMVHYDERTLRRNKDLYVNFRALCHEIIGCASRATLKRARESNLDWFRMIQEMELHSYIDTRITESMERSASMSLARRSSDRTADGTTAAMLGLGLYQVTGDPLDEYESSDDELDPSNKTATANKGASVTCVYVCMRE